MSMRIEILTFNGCPNAHSTHVLVQQAVRMEGVVAHLHLIEVDTPDDALNKRFLGSPSVRVDGEDIEPSANDRTRYGLMCRTYSHGAEVAGSPSIDMIRAAIRRRAASKKT